MFTSFRQDPGFRQSSGTRTWKRRAGARDHRCVHHQHWSLWVIVLSLFTEVAGLNVCIKYLFSSLNRYQQTSCPLNESPPNPAGTYCAKPVCLGNPVEFDGTTELGEESDNLEALLYWNMPSYLLSSLCSVKLEDSSVRPSPFPPSDFLHHWFVSFYKRVNKRFFWPVLG